MGNEFGAADFQPHLVPAIVFERKVDLSGTVADTSTVVVAGGYHPKMRLRYGYAMVVDGAVDDDTTEAQFNILHGSNEVVAAQALTDNDAIGVVDAMTIVDQYKDVAAADQIAIETHQAGAGTGTDVATALVHLEYELVE